jgi:glycosyltransferase involved in cell wall biosynthesis
MEQFQPMTETRSKDPTVVMLSNVQFIKDVKNAILAAGVIINDFGFKNYNLVVYGAQDRQPSYAIETEAMIGNLNISKTVKLGGFGSPKVVLKDAWLFMNSSLSEGLPLAIGEAALSGIPIVATEVGATAQVLTDVDDPDIRYGEIVPPNDPVALARAQISLLAMLGPWTKYTQDEVKPPPLPIKFTPEDVAWITKRMHDKAADRRALGLKLRDVVLRKFNGSRYLREHEQMYWAQRHMADQRSSHQIQQTATRHLRWAQPRLPNYAETAENPDSMWAEPPWQDFGGSSHHGKRNLSLTHSTAESTERSMEEGVLQSVDGSVGGSGRKR